MAGFTCVFGDRFAKASAAALFPAIDPFGIDERKELRAGRGFMAVSARRNTPLANAVWHEGDGFAACFAGDYADGAEIPWASLVDVLRRGRPGDFPEMSGLFAFAFFDTANEALYVASDLYSFFPVFYCLDAGSAIVSTAVASFPRAADFAFNPDWLYEYLFFSFPVGSTGIWKGVRRMPPATVLRHDLRSGETTLTRYGAGFRRAPKLLEGHEALERAFAVFDERMPRYFAGTGEFAHALSGGYDTRTVLAFVPPERERDCFAYTYGREGSGDILESRMVARRLGLRHGEIYFDEAYEARLPELARETVRLAGGLENINRAYLLHVYRTITEGGTRRPFVLSGIGADAIFRGHVPTPNGLSYDMDRSYRTGRISIDAAFFKKVFGPRFDEFYACAERGMNWMVETYGPFGPVENYFAYEIYEGLPRYFNGEASIANHFTSFRIPFVDPGIMRLACEIEYSLFTLWRFINDDKYKESRLQASLMARHPRLGRVRLQGLPLSAFTSGSKPLHDLMRILHKGPARLAAQARRRKKPTLENWARWYETVLRDELDRRLAPDSRVSRYVTPGFVAEMRGANNMHWLKIVATLDVALELAENGWQLQ
jgi:asparagine synthetase B (glutamine-hydrolysing)